MKCAIYKLDRILLTVGGWRAGGWVAGRLGARQSAVPLDTLEKWAHPTSSSNKKSLCFNLQ